MNIKKITLLLTVPFASIYSAYAHCPLCTAGAAAAMAGAGFLGVNKAVLALFLGAFAVSTGLWFARLIKKNYFRFQTHAIVLASFILTVFPLMPMFNYLYPLYISLYGPEGSLLNTMYLINMYYIFTIIGGLMVIYGPTISNKITQLRGGKRIAYQGMIFTFLYLALFGLIIQLIL